MHVSAAPKPIFAGIELLEVDLEQALAPERARQRPTVADRRLPVRRVRLALKLAGAHERRCRTTLVAADRLRDLLQCPLQRADRLVTIPPCWVEHDLDAALRVADPEDDATPAAKSPHGIEIPFLDAPATERTAPTASRAAASLRSRPPRHNKSHP